MRDDQDTDRTVFREMLLVLVGYGIVVEVIGVLFFRASLVSYSAGLWIGIVTAGLMAYNMWKTIRISLDREIGNAEGYIRKKAVIRYALVVAVMMAVALVRIGNPTVRALLYFAGVMGLKVAAYLQPFAHKILRR